MKVITFIVKVKPKELFSIINYGSDVTCHNVHAIISLHFEVFSYNWDMWYLMFMIFVPCLLEIFCGFNLPYRKEKSSYSKTKSRGCEIHSSWTARLHSWMCCARRIPVWSTASTSWKQWVWCAFPLNGMIVIFIVWPSLQMFNACSVQLHTFNTLNYVSRVYTLM